ncbi:MAG: NADH-quinone oxidoreductase subunit A [Solitalea-like symbiont of Tyrophagus putrescentiae]
MVDHYFSIYFGLALQMIVAIGFVTVTLFFSHMVGAKSRNKIKDENFESGVEAIGNAREPFDVQYFLTAILFLIFDIEVVFMYPWAVAFKELSGDAIITMAIFLFIVCFGLFYEIKKGFFTRN